MSTRKPVDDKTLREIATQLMNRGIGELHTRGLTEEEESNHIQKTFQEIADLGYQHIHTLEVIPEDGRKPYLIHRNDAARS